MLSNSEISQIHKHRDKLEAVIETGSAAELKQLIKAIEAASEFYVARRMNASVQEALTGKQINEVDV